MRKDARWIVPCLVMACSGASPRPDQTEERHDATAPEEVPPLGRLPSDVRPTNYGLELTLRPDQDRYSGVVTISVELDRPRSVVWLHGRDLHVTEARIEGEGGATSASWNEVPDSEGVVALRPERPLQAGHHVIRLAFDAAFDRQLRGLYRVDTGGESYAFTQMEPISARQAFPCFDEPAFKTPFDVTLVVAADDVAISNTLEVETTPGADGTKRVRFATTERLPTYLVAFAVGPLDVVSAPDLPANGVRTKALRLRGVAAKGRGERLRYALAHTPPFLEALERYFGSPYPFDKLDLLAVPDFASGGMENAGAITFRESLLLIDEATAPEDQKRAYASVMAHELAHMWFGDLVTMPWWDDIWLNEAFATWMGHRVVAEVHPEHKAGVGLLERVHGAMGYDSLVSARRIRQPIESHHDIRNAFDAITYSKGAGVLAMFERWIGAEKFRRGIQSYLESHRYGSATAEDLLRSLSEAAGRDVSEPFESFLAQPGVPLVEAAVTCEDGRARIPLKQSRYLPIGSEGDRAKRWLIPVCTRSLVGRDVREQCTLLSDEAGEVALEGGTCPTWVMPNADGAGYYRWSLAAGDLEKLRTRGWASLQPRERLSVADSLGAAFAGAKLPARDVLASFEPLARDPERAIATAPMGLLRFAREYLADDAMRPKVETFARKLYAPVHKRLGWDARPREDGETRLLRREVVSFLALIARDPAVRREAAARGRRLVGAAPTDPLRTDAVASELVDVALTVAVQEGDAALFEALLTRFRASDQALLRSQLLEALGGTHDPALAERARALSLDPGVRVNETMTTLSSQIREPEMRVAAWQWIETHFDELLARLSQRGAGALPWMASSFCETADAARVTAFFGGRIESLPGGPRNLAAATEAIRLCAARVEAQRPSAREFFH